MKSQIGPQMQGLGLRIREHHQTFGPRLLLVSAMLAYSSLSHANPVADKPVPLITSPTVRAAASQPIVVVPSAPTHGLLGLGGLGATTQPMHATQRTYSAAPRHACTSNCVSGSSNNGSNSNNTPASAQATVLVLTAMDKWMAGDIERAVLKMAQGMANSPSTGTLPERLQAFVDHAPDGGHGYNMTINSSILGQSADGALVVVSVDGYFYTGGAHGSATRVLLNFDRRHHRLLTPKDILQQGQSFKQNPALYPLYHAQFARFVKENGEDNLADYEKMWKFHLSDQWRLGELGLVMQYGQYDIGPYVIGMPELTVPYSALHGIIRPEYLRPVQATRQTGEACPCPTL